MVREAASRAETMVLARRKDRNYPWFMEVIIKVGPAYLRGMLKESPELSKRCAHRENPDQYRGPMLTHSAVRDNVIDWKPQGAPAMKRNANLKP
jgi:hypothetical protein